jgi:hypothetical protein
LRRGGWGSFGGGVNRMVLPLSEILKATMYSMDEVGSKKVTLSGVPANKITKESLKVTDPIGNNYTAVVGEGFSEYDSGDYDGIFNIIVEKNDRSVN